MEAELPEGSKLEFVIDQSEYVRKAIESLIHEGDHRGDPRLAS